MLTYLGKGYTPDFVSNYSRLVDRLNAGEDVVLVQGPDDICQPMLSETQCHCHNESVRMRDDQASTEIGRILGLELRAGDRINLTCRTVERLRDAFSAGDIRSACGGCEWQELCSRIAGNKFRGCHLAPPV